MLSSSEPVEVKVMNGSSDSVVNRLGPSVTFAEASPAMAVREAPPVLSSD